MTTINKDGKLDIDLGDRPTIGHRLEKLEETIKLLEERIDLLEGGVFIPAVGDFEPSANKCSICDLDFSASMGYVCDNMLCPLYPKIGDNYAPGSTTG